MTRVSLPFSEVSAFLDILPAVSPGCFFLSEFSAGVTAWQTDAFCLPTVLLAAPTAVPPTQSRAASYQQKRRFPSSALG